MERPSEGTCFESAGRWLLKEPHLKEARLAHGLVNGTGRASGQSFAHAWIEIGDVVIDTESGWIGRREEYYGLGEVREVRLYELDEMVKKVLKSRHWGPWEDEAGN